MNAIESMLKRKSVRTYTFSALSSDDLSRLKKIAAKVKGPFGTVFRLEFFTQQNKWTQTNEGLKVATYGVIRGAENYIAGIVSRGAYDLEQLGFAMEELILHATNMNLGTCWLGGTFNKKSLGTQVNLNQNEWMPVITPIGYPAGKESLISKTMKKIAKSSSRKDWSALFFRDSLLHPLSASDAGSYEKVLEMVRLAPSASNKQPWRIVRESGCFHFYFMENIMTSKALGFALQRVDMGIAMCHFELAARELNLEGEWQVLPNPPRLDVNNLLPYLVSWRYEE